MTAIDDALKANEAYAAGFARGNLPTPPARKLAIVSCMDSRIDLVQALGLQLGDAHMIRNAGGRVADALRSLIISQLFLGTEQVMIIHHTECGLLNATDEAIRDRLREHRGADAGHIAFLPFTDLEQSVRDDLALYNASPLTLDTPARGFIYDVDTGKLTEVT